MHRCNSAVSTDVHMQIRIVDYADDFTRRSLSVRPRR